MNDVPYTTPDEDPFNVRPLQLQPRRRRSSLLDKWIQDQRSKPEDEPSQRHPYLSYPELPADPKDDAVTFDNYDFVTDDDIPQAPTDDPTTPTIARTRRTSKLLHTPSSFRSFKPFRPTSPAVSSVTEASSPRSSRFSFLPRTPRSSKEPECYIGDKSSHQHTRSTSLSTLNISGKSPLLSETHNASTSSRWRPSVLGHFSTPSTSQISTPSDTIYAPPRPSMSSVETYTSGTVTTSESEFPMTPSRLHFMDSMRFRTKSNGSVLTSGSGLLSSGSLQSQKLETSLGNSSTPAFSIIGSTVGCASASAPAHCAYSTRIPLAPKPGSKLSGSNMTHVDEDSNNHAAKRHDPTRPRVAYSSGGTLPRVSLAALSSRNKKKRKLVVSGVGLNDARKFEGVKRWCESFGEVSQIVRMPNSDLHVHFRQYEVAETVCRVRAKVYIAGVGSVQLSWFKGDKQ